MKVPSRDNTYALLACFLSPWKDCRTVEELSEAIYQAKVDWENLLYMANVHLCTPLWFVRLREDGLLPSLPPELQAYLMHLHQANVERNEVFQKAAREILTDLQHFGVPVIFLKGAATFCDNLYGDLGARMMVDLDLLVKPKHLELTRDRLLRLGYQEQIHEREVSGYFGAYAPHHLPPFAKPGTPLAVEIHFKAARGQAGRVLSADVSWANSQTEAWENLTPLVLAPSYRLLHNTVHALVPFGRFVGASVSLAQLAEFAHLTARYGSSIDWPEWLRQGTSQGLGRQFRVYLNLAHELMAVPLSSDVPGISSARMHVARVSVAANYRAFLHGCQNQPEHWVEKARWFGVGTYVFLYSRLARPAWVWHNFCYKEGLQSIPIRLLCLLGFFLNWNKIRTILNIRGLRDAFAKVICLWRKPKPSVR